MTSPKEIYNELFSSEVKIEEHMKNNTIIIVHCEFSSYRAPQTYNLIRKTDRKINEKRYPMICYPELYILENGYKEFFQTYPVSDRLKVKYFSIKYKWHQIADYEFASNIS